MTDKEALQALLVQYGIKPHDNGDGSIYLKGDYGGVDGDHWASLEFEFDGDGKFKSVYADGG
jgi:hypothetical protein